MSASLAKPAADGLQSAFALTFHGFVGSAFTLLSTFVGERSAFVVYADIMGCENGCVVVATGWPLVFVTDYLGMSVVGTADIMEAWFAADRFTWGPFLINVGAWALASIFVTGIVCGKIRKSSSFRSNQHRP